MTNMAQIETAMFESVTAKTKNLSSLTKQERPKRECRSRKRPYDLEQYSSKRLKYDQIDFDDQNENFCTFGLTTSDTDDDNDTESKCSTSDDTEQLTMRQFDDNSDIEEIDDETTNIYFSKISSDQQRHIPVVLNETIIPQKQTLSRHSKRLISQFKYYYDHGLRKAIQATNSLENFNQQSNEIYFENLRWELRNTFNRIDLFKEGYCVLSNEPFPFYSLCYMCGSIGSELIYCNNCCEAYHSTCLNEYERPQLNSSSKFWLCPNCNVCRICGLLTYDHILSRMTNESIQLISCFDCKKTFHLKCIKKSSDEQLNELNNSNSNNNNNSILSLSRLSNSYLLNQTWFCPSCIKCDCGNEIISNERNILILTKTYSSQQSLMCKDCLNNLKLIHLDKNDNIEKCFLCEKYIEQIFLKQQHQQQMNSLLQCIKCKNRFHSKCDGYLNEDIYIIPSIKNLSFNIICSKCDLDERENIRKYLIEYKIQAIKTIETNIFSTFQLIINDKNQLNQIETYLFNLQQLYESHYQSLNLQTYLNDLLIILQRFLSYNQIQSWQSVLNGCIIRQCPWFKSSLFLSNKKSFNQSFHLLPPTIDHTYAIKNEYILNNLTTNSLLNYFENNFINKKNQFKNFHRIDTRKCQLCETLSDHNLINIGRLISFGINQWVHVGCILAAYAKNLDQPPYILRNIRETIIRCQTKYICTICSKLGASVHCYENECYQRFHCVCIQKYYSTMDKTYQQQLNIKNGFLPNLTTLCLKHNGLKINNSIQHENIDGMNEDELKEFSNNNVTNLSKIKCVNTSSTVYGDLSNNLVEFSLINTRLCIGSLQIESLGNFDYHIDKIDDNFLPYKIYPNNYRASRLFWSIKNPREKTIYHLHIEINQSYHYDRSNHKIIQHPMTIEQIHNEQLYEICRKYFKNFQKHIDEHLNNIEEFCQKTMINKKGILNQTTTKKKTNHTGSIGTTKRLTKGTPSCVKRQTPKSALKNVSRPRNRFANEKNPQISSLVTKSNPSPKDNLKNIEIQNLFSNDYLKSTNVSQFALALVQALRQVGQSTKIQQESNINYYLTNPTLTTEKSNDTLLKQLLKNINIPQQLNDSQIATINSSQWRSTISTQTETTSLSKSYDDIKLNGHSQHSYSSLNGAIISSHTTDNTSNLFSKSTFIPQVDGSMDDIDENIHICSIIINSLIEQIILSSEYIPKDNEYSKTFFQSSLRNENKSKSISSFDLIQLYQEWLKKNFFHVKFTITNNEGYQIISDDLDHAWSNIINLIRNTRDDRNFEHLPMTNDELNGHKIFGLTKPIIKIMLNQMYTNQQQIGNILLPLSSSSSLNNNNDSNCTIENLNKKNSLSSSSRTNIYERKTRERQRFGWLLNQSRKIEYALKSFEIDDALLHARRILLEEASVSLRLYHLHYFSERALLVASSPIHGCGLFTLIDLVEGQMIIEYTGEVVRPCLTDKRERENEGKGFGCYMFTVDSMNVIDATHRGDKARFINHNCQPNCFAKTVLSGGIKHIVIYALMDIPRGSELTYDYSFPEEDIKIPCHCGTSKCRIYLN